MPFQSVFIKTLNVKESNHWNIIIVIFGHPNITEAAVVVWWCLIDLKMLLQFNWSVGKNASFWLVDCYDSTVVAVDQQL